MDRIKELSLYRDKEQEKIYKALANAQRLAILRVLADEPLSVHQLSGLLQSPVTTVTNNVNILEEAGLIETRLQSGTRGTIRLCSIVYEKIVVDLLPNVQHSGHFIETKEIPIGNYFDFEVRPTCGLVDTKGFIGKDDDPNTFYSESRLNAQLIWFYEGYLEYRFPVDASKKIERIDISMEICSEAPGYREDWPSDISLFLNGVLFLTYTADGDYGGRRGKNTPFFWPLNSTQFGILKTFSITRTGSFIDGKISTPVSLSDIRLSDVVRFRLGINPFAKNKGGINLFGKYFGDYPQDIVVKIFYATKN